MHRLYGDFEHAERDYREASRHGYDPMPGLALLQLARGNGRAAAVMTAGAYRTWRRSVATGAAGGRSRNIPIHGRFRGCPRAADELSAIAGPSTSQVLQAMAAKATGRCVEAGDVAAALVELRTAARTWQSLHMPYDAARTALLVGLACAALGDQTGAEVEFDYARDIFTKLGATPDLERANALMGGLADGVHPRD